MLAVGNPCRCQAVWNRRGHRSSAGPSGAIQCQLSASDDHRLTASDHTCGQRLPWWLCPNPDRCSLFWVDLRAERQDLLTDRGRPRTTTASHRAQWAHSRPRQSPLLPRAPPQRPAYPSESTSARILPLLPGFLPAIPPRLCTCGNASSCTIGANGITGFCRIPNCTPGR